MSENTDKPVVEIDVFSDPVCPWCFIGKRRLAAALEQRPDIDARIRWRTFQLNPDMPSEGMERQTYLSAKFGGPERASEIYSHIGRVGAQVGIDFRFDQIRKTPNTVLAHRLIRFAGRPEHAQGEKDCGEEVVRALFESYFLNGEDIGDTKTLLDIAEKCGMDRDATAAYLDGDEDEEDVRAEDEFARRLGIGGVPCFIIDGRYALSGAQEPEAFLPVFDTVLQENREQDEVTGA